MPSGHFWAGAAFGAVLMLCTVVAVLWDDEDGPPDDPVFDPVDDRAPAWSSGP